MNAERIPLLAVIGSGVHAMCIISSFEAVVAAGRLQIVWIVPSAKGKASIFDGRHSWIHSESVALCPLQASLNLHDVVMGPIDWVAKEEQRMVVFSGGRCVRVDAAVLALDPSLDGQVGDDFMQIHRCVHRFDPAARLLNRAQTPINIFSGWQAQTLHDLLRTTEHRHYTQSSLRPQQSVAKKPTHIRQSLFDDEDEHAGDDDDDMEYLRPTVIDFVLPTCTTTFAESLMSTSDRNAPELLHFAMNEGEHVLPLNHLKLGDAEMQRIFCALREHYVVRCGPSSASTSTSKRDTQHQQQAVLLRDVTEVLLAANNITSLSPITDALVWTRDAPHLPISSMLRVLDLSYNPLDHTSVAAFVSALLQGTNQTTTNEEPSTSKLSSLSIRSCGLDDNVGELLAKLISRMSSLKHLDVGNNHFSAGVSATLLRAARHHLEDLSICGIPLSGCEEALGALFMQSQSLTRLDASDCELDNAAVLAIGEAFVVSANRDQLQRLNLSNNPQISTEGVRFLFECIATFANSIETCALTEVLVMGCGPVGLEEMGAIAYAIQTCKRLESVSLSLIDEEQLALQILVDTIVKHSYELVAFDYDLVELRTSRCDTSLRTPSGVQIPDALARALQGHLSANRSRKEARQEQVTGRSLLNSTILHVAAEAARSVPLPPIGGGDGSDAASMPTHYLRIDDSGNHKVYENQLNASAMDLYRYEQFQRVLSASGCHEGATVETVGYRCGSVDTWNASWEPFCDVVVKMDPPKGPKFLSCPYFASAFQAEEHAVLTNGNFEVTTSPPCLMFGFASRMPTTNVPFCPSLNSGVHWAFVSELIAPAVRSRVLQQLCPSLRCRFPSGDGLGQLMKESSMSAYVLRQRLLEAVAAPFQPIDAYIARTQLKRVVDAIAHRIVEVQPAPFIPLEVFAKEEDGVGLQPLFEVKGIAWRPVGADTTADAAATHPHPTDPVHPAAKKDAAPPGPAPGGKRSAPEPAATAPNASTAAGANLTTAAPSFPASKLATFATRTFHTQHAIVEVLSDMLHVL